MLSLLLDLLPQVVGGCALFVALVVLSPLRRSAAAIFTQYQSFPRVTGVYGVPFTVVQGLYFAVMTQNGWVAGGWEVIARGASGVLDSV